jgi:hypothetical protein
MKSTLVFLGRKAFVLSAAITGSMILSGIASADIRLLGAGGLTQLTPKSDSTPSTKAFTGAEGKLALHFDIFAPLPGVSLYAGPELRFGTAMREYDDATTVKVKETLKSTTANLEAGVHVGVIPVLSLQGGLTYGFPTGGSKEVQTPLKTVSGNTNKGSELGVTLRALITPFPMTRLGAEYSIGNGNTTYETIGEMKYSFWAARAVLGIAL